MRRGTASMPAPAAAPGCPALLDAISATWTTRRGHRHALIRRRGGTKKRIHYEWDRFIMTMSMLGQILFHLPCGHHVVLGRLAHKSLWNCDCGKKTDLAAEPYKTALERDLDTATQIDLQARERGETVTRAG
jgi:hypothetical protein